MRIITSATRDQNRNCEKGRNIRLRCFDVWRMGTSMRIKIENNRASTPPSLFGIDRRMVYAKRKYHSGLIWGGVTSGFAGVKLSGSPKRFGENKARAARAMRRAANPRRSLYEKYGWKGTLSESEFNPVGLLEPVSCRKIRWITVAAAMTNGNRKWNAKNRVSVALSTENPPQIHCTRVLPT